MVLGVVVGKKETACLRQTVLIGREKKCGIRIRNFPQLPFCPFL
jgi:hypothetical protein